MKAKQGSSLAGWEKKEKYKSGEISDPSGPGHVASLLPILLDLVKCFCFFGTDGWMCENDDHLYGRGLVGQLQ